MSSHRRRTLTAMVIAIGSIASPAAAQELVALADPETETAEPAAAAGGAAPTATVAVDAEPAASGDDPTRPEDAPEPAAVPAMAPPPAPASVEEPEGSWVDQLSFRAFADAYVGGYWTLADPLEGDHADVAQHRAFDTFGGPTIAFAGFDVTYAPSPIGATLNLRFGTSVPRLIGPTSGLPDGMQFLKQAFVSWRPVEQLQIDFGEFDTIYGAEVSESWVNPTYTRGALYTLVQPYWHTGFRAAWSPIPQLTLTAIAVNGWNNVVDDNDGKSVGVQGTISLGDFVVALGYMTGPEQAGIDDRFRHFADLVVRWEIGPVTLWGNGDLVIEDFGDHDDTLAGGMIAGRVSVVPEFAVAAREEYIGDPDTGTGLVTSTLTLEALPDPHFVIRLDTRVDYATDARFVDTNAQPTNTMVSTTLGVVARTD